MKMQYWVIFLTALKLGVTSFGGPIAHLGYFRNEYVEKKKWLSSAAYQEIVALCQFLPGPASSQVGITIGLLKGGIIGAVLAFLGFTLPSVFLLILASITYQKLELDAGLIQGLKVVAVVIVLHAIIGMIKQHIKGVMTALIAIFCLLLLLFLKVAWLQVVLIILSGLLGACCFKQERKHQTAMSFQLSKRFGWISLSLLVFLMLVLPLVAYFTKYEDVVVFDKLFRTGLLVFGGGHVVLPLLQNEFVPQWINEETFITGYGLAQAVPGPLFTFASFLGASIKGIYGGILAMVAIFLPAFLLVFSVMPFWETMRDKSYIRNGLIGVNAAVVGILMASFISPILQHGIIDIKSGLLSVFLYFLIFKKQPPWIIVLLGGTIGYFML